MTNIIITNHAYTRWKERLWLNKKAFQRTIEKWFQEWIPIWKIKGHLKKYIHKCILWHPYKLSVLVYSEFLILYRKHKNNTEYNSEVITIYKIPWNLTPLNKYIISN